jgi:hypothetical protein
MTLIAKALCDGEHNQRRDASRHGAHDRSIGRRSHVELENNPRNYHMGKSRIRAAIDIDDGTLASVVWLDDAAGSNNAPAGSKVRRPLRVDELIVVSNQGELDDKSTIDATVLPAN